MWRGRSCNLSYQQKLYRLAGVEPLQPLMSVIKGSLGEAELSAKQKDAVQDLRRAFKI